MKALIPALLLTCVVAAGQVTKTPEVARRFGHREQLHSSIDFRFRNAFVSCRLVRDAKNEPRRFWRFAANGIGRFTSAFLVPLGRLAAPDEAWMVGSGTGTTLARARLPLERKAGHVTVDMAELGGCAGWLFVRLSTTADKLPAIMVSARNGVFQPVMGGTPSRLHLVWPGGLRGAGELPPWNGGQPRFNAIAFFARGHEAYRGSDLLVFEPEDVAYLRLQRWDSVVIPVFTPAAACRQTVFAFGAYPGPDAEGIAIPEFMEKGRHRVADIMRRIVWTPPPADFTRLNALRAEICDLLERYPDADLRAQFAAIEARVDAFTPGDLGAITPLQDELRILAEKVADQALRRLLSRAP